MTIDYATHKLTIGRKLPEEKPEFTLPMRHHRLSLVRGLLNDKRPTYFVVDTGGEVISISTTTAEELDHDIRARSRCASTARRAGIAMRS
jgi:hypothetical protein